MTINRLNRIYVSRIREDYLIRLHTRKKECPHEMFFFLTRGGSEHRKQACELSAEIPFCMRNSYICVVYTFLRACTRSVYTIQETKITETFLAVT